MKIGGREPAVWIGIIVSCILAVLTVLTGNDVITTDRADQISNLVQSLANILVIVSPLITGLLVRPVVTPTAQPSLPVGQSVTVSGTADSPPPDAIVARVEDVAPNSPSATLAAQK